jgi:hypothetical protein
MHIAGLGIFQGKPRQRMSFAQHPTTTADWCDVGRVAVDIPHDVGRLLKSFVLYMDQAPMWFLSKDRGMAYAAAHVSKNGEASLWVATSPESPSRQCQ